MRAILTYHSVDRSGSVISVSPRRFAREMAWLSTGAVAVVSVPELLARSGDGPAVALTFDDGFTNFENEAWPLLLEHGLPVTLFIPTRLVGGPNDWTAMPGARMPTLQILDWNAIGRLAEAGVAIGAHSRTHPDLRLLDAGALSDEVEGSVEDIERETGRRPEGFCYPYGHHDERVVASVRHACRWACTTELRPLGKNDDPHGLPRLDAYYLRGPGALSRFGSSSFRGYLSLRAAIRRWRRR